MTDCAGKYGFTYDEIKLPRRGTAQSAGYDFFSNVDITLLPGETIKLPTGIKFDCDSDKFLGAYPRSGHGFKYGIMLANTVGIIDADYYNNPGNEGHIWVKLTYPQQASISVDPFVIKKGDAIFQGIIQPYFTVEDDDAAGERVGGFGSTNK
jgi:dUTP pyrophosphatase